MGPGNSPFNFKTKVCNKWQIGACPFGAKCHFAHGQVELRQRQPLPGGDVPGAPDGEWQETLRYLKLGINPPAQPPPTAAALAAVAAAAANGEYAYPDNPYGDFIEDLIQPDAETPTYSDTYASNGAPEGYPPSPRAPGGPPPSGPQQLGPPGMHQMPHHPPQQGHFDQGRPQYQSYNNYPPSGNGALPMPPPGRPGTGYKMTLCESYMVYGACPYGDTCYDSHGDSELRQTPQRPPDAYPQ
mmetsp:Transcript_33874/g.56881  ORF Transcript_33874/g.56881 Transcript_33874/m.56881 type:complete len:242 (-) Transcript_33874:87-812(-)